MLFPNFYVPSMSFKKIDGRCQNFHRPPERFYLILAPHFVPMAEFIPYLLRRKRNVLTRFDTPGGIRQEVARPIGLRVDCHSQFRNVSLSIGLLSIGLIHSA